MKWKQIVESYFCTKISMIEWKFDKTKIKYDEKSIFPPEKNQKQIHKTDMDNKYYSHKKWLNLIKHEKLINLVSL